MSITNLYSRIFSSQLIHTLTFTLTDSHACRRFITRAVTPLVNPFPLKKWERVIKNVLKNSTQRRIMARFLPSSNYALQKQSKRQRLRRLSSNDLEIYHQSSYFCTTKTLTLSQRLITMFARNNENDDHPKGRANIFDLSYEK